MKKISIKDLDQEEIDKIKQEAKILSDLDNENIIKYYGCKEEDDYFNIVMEYGGKSNLYNFIQSYRQKNENIEESIPKVANTIPKVNILLILLI